MNDAYTILRSQTVGFDGGKVMKAVVISVDTVEDVPEPLPTWTRGSICLISKGHQFKSLNSKGEWE